LQVLAGYESVINYRSGSDFGSGSTKNLIPNLNLLVIKWFKNSNMRVFFII
jgi:hypothetical protein